MDIATLYTDDLADSYGGLLEKGSWANATVYLLSTDSTFWNTASIINLPKTLGATAPVALLYLLQVEAK